MDAETHALFDAPALVCPGCGHVYEQDDLPEPDDWDDDGEPIGRDLGDLIVLARLVPDALAEIDWRCPNDECCTHDQPVIGTVNHLDVYLEARQEAGETFAWLAERRPDMAEDLQRRLDEADAPIRAVLGRK